MNFKELLYRARQGDKDAILEIIRGGENECRELLHLDHLFMDFFEIK